MSTLRSAGGKGSLYTDASWRTAAIRKNAILKGQFQKCEVPISECSVLSGANALKKPLVGEYHLQKGFTAGVTELILVKNKNGFI
jgi:hypothetical protein